MSLMYLLVFVLGCGSTSGQPTTEPDSKHSATSNTPTAAATGDAPSASTKADDALEAKRRETAMAALKNVPAIVAKVAEIRKLPFKREVPATYQPTNEFRSFVQSEISKEMPQEESDKFGRSLFHLGLLKTKVDLVQSLQDTMVTQAGAYYDPAQGKFFVVKVFEDKNAMDTMVAHEIMHALQDQHFDLRGYYGDAKDGKELELSSDQEYARRFIVEGEATLIMQVYGAEAVTGTNMLAKDQASRVRIGLQMMANMTVDFMRQATKMQASSAKNLTDDMKKSIDAMDKIPPIIMEPLLGSYLKGALPVYEMYMAKGWDGVAELYTDPPQSTEQVLHPRAKLVGKRDYPVHIAFQNLAAKLPANAKELVTDTLGELSWRVYFALWGVKDPVAAADGWDGDRVAVYDLGNGQSVGVIATEWDTAREAKQFAEAYAQSLTKRFPAGKPTTKKLLVHTRPQGSKVLVKRVGKRVFIVDGAREATDIAWAQAISVTKHTKDSK